MAGAATLEIPEGCLCIIMRSETVVSSIGVTQAPSGQGIKYWHLADAPGGTLHKRNKDKS